MNTCQHGWSEGAGCDHPGCWNWSAEEKDYISAFLATVSTVAELRFALGVIEESLQIRQYANECGLRFDANGAWGDLAIKSQVTKEGFRSDFVFQDFTVFKGWHPILIVEIDDPSHWKLPGKAQGDRVRDRLFLVRGGVPTMRFSNEEVMSQRNSCVREVFGFLDQYARRQYEELATKARSVQPDPEEVHRA